MFLHVIGVRHLSQYSLEITFNNGHVKEVDLSEELYGEVFEPLRDQALFRQVYVSEETGTIEWPTGADLAPEYLYEKGVDTRQVA